MRALTKSQTEIIDTLAHINVALDISRNVEGFGDFFQHYIDNAMTDKQRQIWRCFQSRIPEIKQDFARQLKESA